MRRERPSDSSRKQITQFARQLRRESTPAEKLLWTRLQGDQLGVRFRRQFRIEQSIIDFYCPTCLLAIELDGDSHNEKEESDRKHTARLSELGVLELRFTNQTIFRSLNEVVQAIYDVVQTRKGLPQ